MLLLSMNLFCLFGSLQFVQQSKKKIMTLQIISHIYHNYLFKNFQMSDSEEDDDVEEEEEDDEEEQDDEEEDDEEEDDEQDDDEDEEGSGDEDQDEDQDEEDEEEGSENQDEETQKPVPTFKQIHIPQEVKFQNLISEIASIGNTVDSFISSLPSRGGSYTRSYVPRTPYIPPKIEPILEAPKQYTVMKDEDTQVSMQPQIIIQQTVPPKQEIKKQPYKISNESTKFLAQLYEQNKKLKRWKNNMTASSGYYGTSGTFGKQKFERGQHEKGLINIEDHNKQIDEAIEMLRREDYEQ